MALFSRRVLQRVLYENAAFLPAKELSNICHLLNTVRDDYLATEWEQVILNAASKVGSIQYEPTLGGRRKPDLLLRSKSSFEFIADITTASDKGLNRLNPVDALHEEFERHQRKRKLLNGGFDVRIDSHSRTIYRGSNETVSLMLPKRSEFKAKIFNAAFHKFMDSVCSVPDRCRAYHARDVDTSIHFIYDPRKRGRNAGQHLSYTVANRLDQNPVYNALKSKGDQLKAVGYNGIRGIFLCDGGCQMLRTGPTWANFGRDEVVRYFLKQFDSVAFVVALVVREKSSSSKRDIIVEPTLYSLATRGGEGELQAVVAELLRQIPKLVDAPENALRQHKLRNGLSGRYWGNLVMGSDIRMSARVLLEILAGEKSLSEFERDFGLKPGENPFKQRLESGRLISEVSIERRPDEDDDVVTLRFGNRDAAVGAFSVSSSKPVE
jgi:hypothetical protein